jgi:hypothetical protein
MEINMKYADLFHDINIEARERYELSMERIESMIYEHTIKEPWNDYFKKVASFILLIKELIPEIEDDNLKDKSFIWHSTINYEYMKM